MEELQINDIVVFKAKPNSGEMIVTEIHEKTIVGFPFRSKFDPAVIVKFWDEVEKSYMSSTFYRSELEFKRR